MSIPPLPAPPDSRHDFFERANCYLWVNAVQGHYAEFGCYSASTFRCALSTLGNEKRFRGKNIGRRFFAFDSFEGMPEPKGIDKQAIFERGSLRTTEEEFRSLCGPDLHRITIVKGFYEDTLPGYPWNPGQEIALAYLDCDYHSSSLAVLRFIRDKMSHGGIIGFDDWNMYFGDPQRGQKLAFAQFTKESESAGRLEPYQTIGYVGMSFIWLKKELIGREVG